MVWCDGGRCIWLQQAGALSAWRPRRLHLAMGLELM